MSALALDPAVQGIVYCAIFMLMPLGHALIPLLLKESVYLLWVIKEVLQIAAPGDEHSRFFLVFLPKDAIVSIPKDAIVFLGRAWAGTNAGRGWPEEDDPGRRAATYLFVLFLSRRLSDVTAVAVVVVVRPGGCLPIVPRALFGTSSTLSPHNCQSRSDLVRSMHSLTPPCWLVGRLVPP